jgi:hypothetical protein
MKFEALDPTVKYCIHSPYEVITDNSIFIEVGPTDEIESTLNIDETM